MMSGNAGARVDELAARMEIRGCGEVHGSSQQNVADIGGAA